MLFDVFDHKVIIHTLECAAGLICLDNQSESGELFSCIAEFDVGLRAKYTCFLFEGLGDLDGGLLVVDGDVRHDNNLSEL